MATIKRIRSLKGVGILADRSAKDALNPFLKVNLIYGFNGSGKSTLSRVFACLQKGKEHDELPEGCRFEIELDDGAVLSSPSALAGLEQKVCVFNTDFVNENLQWASGTATSIFYLSQAQADLVAQLKALEAALPVKRANLDGTEKTAKASAKTYATYCTERAKTVHSARHMGSRKYEAPKLKADYENTQFDETSILDSGSLLALQDIVSRSAPPAALTEIAPDGDAILTALGRATELSELSLGAALLSELEQHPSMVSWMKEGHEYHTAHSLDTCLLCQNPLSAERKAQLATGLNDRLAAFMSDIGAAERECARLTDAINLRVQTFPKSTEFDPALKASYELAISEYKALSRSLLALLQYASDALSLRRQTPLQPVECDLPKPEDNAETVGYAMRLVSSINDQIKAHNALVSDFIKRQDEASISILRHYLADGEGAYRSAKTAAEADAAKRDTASTEVSTLEAQIADLRSKVRTHGPAAETITKLVHRYLGHKDLTVIATENGYLLHRNGRPVKGQPSEGEKTAIAICYFLTTLEADGRSLKDLIVVVDDPISSLDTKAMNYACVLVLKHLDKTAQLFVLTHNQHCMNEFKKAWKSRAYPKNSGTAETGRFYFLEVQSTEGTAVRSATLGEMSHFLREYDSEYHFLCHEILKFEATGATHSPNLLLMPNIMRRVMEIFLAFKVPVNGPIKDKLKNMTDRHTNLDPIRIAALERLSQVESHSDNLDDLIGHSPMTVEEARDTCAALLELMSIADPEHTAAIRKYCKP